MTSTNTTLGTSSQLQENWAKAEAFHDSSLRISAAEKNYVATHHPNNQDTDGQHHPQLITRPGTGSTPPQPAGEEFVDWQKEFNTTINKIRYVIERAISHFKAWWCMHTDYRRPKRTYATAFSAIRALHFFMLYFT